MKFAIFGAGGVGAYLGARLADAGHDVSLIARGDHLTALRSDGLHVESVAGDTTVDLSATDDPGEIGPVDCVLFTVKSYDTRDAAAVPRCTPRCTTTSFTESAWNSTPSTGRSCATPSPPASTPR